MKIVLALLFLCGVADAKDVRVRGSTDKSGEYTPPHHRSSPDSSKSNNYGTKGNVNPYTGKEGKE